MVGNVEKQVSSFGKQFFNCEFLMEELYSTADRIRFHMKMVEYKTLGGLLGSNPLPKVSCIVAHCLVVQDSELVPSDEYTH